MAETGGTERDPGPAADSGMGGGGASASGGAHDQWLVVDLLAHDLLGRLTAISGFADLLREPGAEPLSEVQRAEFLGSIGAAARRMEAMLRDLLALSRAETGSLRPHQRPSPVTQTIEALLEGLDLNGHAVRIDSTVDAASVDPFLFERIAENLILNAIRHTPPGTSITVRVEHAPEAVELIVADDGPGVPAEARQRVFDGLGAPAGTGTRGLGLYLVRRLAELHGGRAWLAETGGGAEFHAFLPGPGPSGPPGAGPGPADD